MKMEYGPDKAQARVGMHICVYTCVSMYVYDVWRMQTRRLGGIVSVSCYLGEHSLITRTRIQTGREDGRPRTDRGLCLALCPVSCPLSFDLCPLPFGLYPLPFDLYPSPPWPFGNPPNDRTRTRQRTHDTNLAHPTACLLNNCVIDKAR